MVQLFTSEENELLTRTDGDAPMGALMREYWVPAFLSERLPLAGGDPIPVKLFGEELVAFRGADGTVGVLDRYCPHRRASLVLARAEGDCALRCVYHGWKMDVHGKVLETPPEPPNSKFAQSVRTTAYPTHEAGAMVWVYMGDRETPPPFPDFPFNLVPEENLWAHHFLQDSNWLQGLEGDVDAGHAGYLHFSAAEWQRQRETASKMGKFLFDPRPVTDVKQEPWGLQTVFHYRLEDQRESMFWVHPFVMPFFTLFSIDFGGYDGGSMHAWVPVDDHSHLVYSVWWSNDGPFPEELKTTVNSSQGFDDVDKDNEYHHKIWTGSGYPQNRAIMRDGTSFSGYDGVHVQDLAVQHSMGPIVDRSKENLGAEDFVVIQLRRYLLEALRDHRSEGLVPGLQDGVSFRDIDHRWVVATAEITAFDVIEDRSLTGTQPVPDEWIPNLAAWSPLPV